MVVAKLATKSPAIELQHPAIPKVSHEHHVEKISFPVDDVGDLTKRKTLKETPYLISTTKSMVKQSQRSPVNFASYDPGLDSSIPDIDEDSLGPSQKTQSTSRSFTMYTIDRDFDQSCFADRKATKAGGYWDKTRGTVKRTLGFIFHKKKWRIDGQYLVTLGQHKIRASTA
ncbi:hypothetical protein K493DRAFT_339338 [Basidiobolus meristosporus CBS 931.73]|uniref:Uncharacterized protein n=1 Tax=Basidiobolus meristosporus CBS 931.73 TaxID=1314790 RepID=A0A1Y1Y1I7_9FUNG|nr:hypothetical protein K493DRAFT_339338 [Basidiobolus meristosporus CBS 931.73]|eukprot:ORX91494.1 hypothetical protein K493DRAFT_339338 [Basidiobolus meristosporus CBS 931.73]